jgi:putative addiction module CopG family antidote
MAKISLDAHHEKFVREQVASGRYRNESEVVRKGLRMLDEREGRVAELRKEIQGRARGGRQLHRGGGRGPHRRALRRRWMWFNDDPGRPGRAAARSGAALIRDPPAGGEGGSRVCASLRPGDSRRGAESLSSTAPALGRQFAATRPTSSDVAQHHRPLARNIIGLFPHQRRHHRRVGGRVGRAPPAQG